jgi:hypothetical protein
MKNQIVKKEPDPIPDMVANPNIQTERGAVFNDLNAQMTAIEAFGTIIARSGFNNCSKVEQGVIIAFTCMAEKITPLDFAQKYDIIQGRPTKKAAVMLAEFRQLHGGDFDWTADGEDGKKATLVLKHNGKKKSPVSFTIEEAKKLGLTSKDNWIKQPGAMLRARCATKALRMYVPEIAAGIYDPDEIPTNVKEGKEINHVSYQAQFAGLVNERSDLEKEKIQVFITEKWPKGMPLETIKRASENFDTFLLTAMKATGGLD